MISASILSIKENIKQNVKLLDETTVVEADLTTEGYSGDSVCAHCQDVKAGAVTPKTGATVNYTGIRNGKDTTVTVPKGSVFAGIEVPAIAHTHTVSGGKHVVTNVSFAGWLLNGEAVASDYVVDEDIVVTASYDTSVVADTNVQLYMLKES